MADQTDLIEFWLSGGSTNIDPAASLGGPISTEMDGGKIPTTAQLLELIVHKLFDEVTKTEAASGDTEYRCFYVKNAFGSELRDTKIFFKANSQSAFTSLELALGQAPPGFDEPQLVSETDEPTGVFFINATPDDPLVIGSLQPGQAKPIWVKRVVVPESLITNLDNATIRVQADRVAGTGAGGGDDGDDDGDDDDGSGDSGDDDSGDGGDDGSGGGAPPTPTALKIAAVGDTNAGSEFRNTLDNIDNFGNANMFIALGDLDYGNDEDDWIDEVKDRYPQYRLFIKPVIGNHDDSEDGSSSKRRQLINEFDFPSDSGFYAVIAQNVFVLIMDTQSEYEEDSHQYLSVEQALEQASSDSQIDWIIVCFHKPMYTAPSDHSGLSDLRDDYHPLFEKYGVDFVLSGHNHNMQRSYPVTFDDDSSPTPTDTSDGPYTNPTGQFFIISGAGGRNRDDIDSKPSWVAFTNDNDYGIFTMEWTNENKTVTCQFVSNDNFEVLHTFVVNKT